MSDLSHEEAKAKAEAEAEAEAEYLRLEIEIQEYKLYNLEKPRTPEKLLGLENSSQPNRWWRAKDPEGSGSFGTVFRESLRAKGSKAELDVRAVKVIKKKHIREDLRKRDSTPIEDWKRELKALIHFSRLQVKYQDDGSFVFFHGWYDDDNRVSLVTEWMELGSLEKVVGEKAKLPEEDVVEIAFQVLKGLQSMHEAHFAHRDLKPQNILVARRGPARGGPSWWVKLADFGFTKKVADKSILQTMRGTEGYMAPEVSREGEPDDVETSRYTFVVDVWSAGCVIFRLLSGDVPKDDPGSKTFHSNVPKFLRDKLAESRITENCLSALEGMIQRDYRGRLSAERALRTPWLEGRASAQQARKARTSTCLTRNISVAQRKQAIDTVKAYIPGHGTSTALLIHQAASEGRLDVVRSLLEIGVDANTPVSDSDSRTPLITIAGSFGRSVSNWHEIMQQLYDGGCDVNERPGVTALFAASEAGFADRVQWLLDHGAGPSLEIACDGLFPLHVASRGADDGHREVVLNLLQGGAERDAMAMLPLGQTALHIAADYGRTKIINRLLLAGADINWQTSITRRTPLHVTIVGMGSATPELVERANRLVRGQRQPDDVPAGFSNHTLEATRLLVERRPRLHVADSKGMTPLHYAAKYMLNEHAEAIILATDQEPTRITGAPAGLRTLCNGESAYKMAWEAAQRRKEEAVIANLLEKRGHTTVEEQEERRKATQGGFLRRFWRTRDTGGGSNVALSSTRSSSQGSRNVPL